MHVCWERVVAAPDAITDLARVFMLQTTCLDQGSNCKGLLIVNWEEQREVGVMLGVIVDEILIRNDCESIGMSVVIIDDSSFYLWVDLSL